MNKLEKKNYMKEYMKNYYSSEYGIIKRMYHHIKERKIKNELGSFDKFYCWVINKTDFREILKTWRATNYKKDYKPSIDRINDYGIYEYSNMQIITWRENWFKGVKSKKNIEQARKNINSPKNNRKGMSKKIIVINLKDGKFYNFNSIRECALKFNLSEKRLSDKLRGQKNIKSLENFEIFKGSSENVTND